MKFYVGKILLFVFFTYLVNSALAQNEITFTNNGTFGFFKEGETTVSADSVSSDEAFIPTQYIAPVINSFTPASGTVGTLLTITGTNLSNPTTLTIGGVSAIPISNDGTTLVAMVMPGATSGAVNITTAGGSTSGSSNFLVTATNYPYQQQGGKLIGTGNIGASEQGSSVSISADGNTAIVGGFHDNLGQGGAWIFTRNAGIWTQQGSKLVGTGNTGVAVQGWSVSISADGNTAIVGGYTDNNYQGAAWIFTRSGTVWTQQGSKLVGTGVAGYAYQGISVSISADGNTAIVGGYMDNNTQGAAWVYTRSAGIWTQQGGKLVGTGNIGGAYQGWSVSISADGNTAIIGGEGDNSSNGAAWVFTRSGGVWTQQGSKLVGTGNIGNAQQGRSVSISADGNTVIIGGDGDNLSQGAAWVFTRSGVAWTQQGGKLVGTGSIGNANQGSSVSISADGNIVVVGGYYDNSHQGAAWVFTRNGSLWTQQGNKFVGTGVAGAYAVQGVSVAISADANTAIVGGDYDNSGVGAAWVFIPGIEVNSSLTAFSTCAGTASIYQSFTVSGSGLSANITITAPSGYEVSTTSGSGYSSSVNLTQSGGSVNSTTIYIRLSNAATGTPSGNITVSSTGLTLQNIAVTGTVNAIPATPSISAGGSTTFCAGGSVELTSSAGGGNQWYNGGVLISGQTAPTYTAATAGNYTVISTQSGCSSAASSATVVTVNSIPATPSISSGGSTTFCTGGSVELTSSAGDGNQWYDGGVLIAGQTTATYTVSTAGNYTVISTQSGCSSAASSATVVTVNAIPATPTISTGGSTTFCTGGSVVLTSSAGGGNQWYDGGVLIAGQTTATYTASTAGNYTVISTQSGCSSAASSVTIVTVNAIPATPTISTGGSTTFCTGGSVELTSSAGGGNQWYDGGVLIAGQTGANYTAATAGNYTVISTQSGCSSAASSATTVTVNSIPATPTISTGGSTTFCTGGSVELTSSAGGGNQWYDGGVLIAGQTGANYTASTAGNYTVISTQSGCSSAASSVTTVTVNAIPATPTISTGGSTTFCAGGSVVLTSSAGGGNQWYDGGVLIAGQTAPTYTAATAGNYTVISTQSGCSSAASSATTVTVNAIPATPTITTGGSTTFCAGGSVELTSSAGDGNQWYNGGVLIAGQTTATYTASTAGNYTVISTQSGCSSAASSATVVTVNAIPATPTISTGGSSTFCAGGNVELTSSAGGGNQWYDGGVLISGQTAPTYTAATAGNYTVISTQSGCSSAASSATTVTVNSIPATPTITTGGSTSFCTGGSVELTSSAGGGNQWYDGGVLIAGQTGANYTASTAGNYTVISTQSGCSSAASSVTTVTVNAIPATPTISTGGSTTFCAGGSVVLTSSAGGGNQWYDGGVLIAGQTAPTYAAATAGNYTVISTQSGCSSAASSVTTVTVNAIPATPSISAGGSSTFCAGGNVELTSSAGGGNQWYDGGVLIAGQTTATYTASTAGNYTVITTSGNCLSQESSQITVSVNPFPIQPTTFMESTTAVCQSQSNVNYSIANDPTVTYNWSYSGSGATLTASSNKLSVAFSNTATMGNISVTANNTCGTTSALTIPVMVNVLPNANFDLPVVCLPLGKAIFKNTSTISDGSQNLLSYLWNFNDPSDLTASTSINPTHYFSGIGPYDIQLTVTSINGCKQSISKYLNTISQGPVSGFSASSLKACVNDKISFTDQSTDISGTLNNWYWDFGNGNTSSLQNPNEQYVDSGSFNISLYVTDQNGCVSDTVTKQLLVYPYPKLILNSPVMVHPNSAVQLVPQYYEGSNLSFIWSPSLYLDSPQIINPVCIPLNDITYMLTITNYGTCSTSDQLSVLLLKMPVIPNAFSPNGDGINDTWVIKYLDRYPNALVSIFDRDGQKIYYSENFTSWDGKYKNQPLPIGTYYYVINLNDGSPLLNGSVTIIR